LATEEARAMSARQPRVIYVLKVEPMRGVDATRALRGLLKLMLRKFGLRCVSLEEVPHA
jgi:hypothetical protein